MGWKSCARVAWAARRVASLQGWPSRAASVALARRGGGGGWGGAGAGGGGAHAPPARARLGDAFALQADEEAGAHGRDVAVTALGELVGHDTCSMLYVLCLMFHVS